MTLEVRGGTRAADTLRAVQSALGQLDGTLALSQVRTARAHFDRALSRERFNAVLLTALGAIALTLGAFGVFGLLSYAVTRRTREIGIRLAIGATPGTILRSTIGQAMRLTAWGLAIGLPAAFGLARLVQGFLFGVNPFDPLVFASAAGLLGAVGVLAGYAPARRASRMDPVRALRCE
jgi:ABC-type antimicrobial peptide transport system permease subunit